MLLVILRIVQGIGVGGEWGGSVLLSMEWGQRQQRGFMASLPQLGRADRPAAVHRRGAAVSPRVGQDGFESWGWRIPFLLSIVLVGIGLYVRLRGAGVARFAQGGEGADGRAQPVWRGRSSRHPRAILCSAFIRMSEQAPFYLFITFVLTYGTKQLKLDQDDLLGYTMIAAAVGLVMRAAVRLAVRQDRPTADVRHRHRAASGCSRSRTSAC